MALTKEQISQLKKQLLEQVKSLPNDQKAEAEAQIENLSDEAIEQMLQNQKEAHVKIFREIVSGKIPSKKIDESSEAVAVLEIKPISKGHTIIIPKNKIEDENKIPETILKFAEIIGSKISKKLDSKKIKMIPELKFGEAIINLIPLYDEDLSLESARSNPSEQDLQQILEKINKKDEPEVKEIKEEKKELKKFPKRIP
ncbi:MAG: HIT domain-containing protein [Nanoarchaeota archaeon]